ncbi:hypothetical protein V8G54_001911 [Vigna mungo]|uniref:Uncharacterized protein n=1 Tax=Vigna mungo TaxID=3915 RepID=A0AAQ3P9H2_VIGMU
MVAAIAFTTRSLSSDISPPPTLYSFSSPTRFNRWSGPEAMGTSMVSCLRRVWTRSHASIFDVFAMREALFDGDVVEEKSAIAFVVWWPLLSGGFTATGLVSEGFDLGLCKNSSSFQKISSGFEVSLQGKQHCGRGDSVRVVMVLREGDAHRIGDEDDEGAR